MTDTVPEGYRKLANAVVMGAVDTLKETSIERQERLRRVVTHGLRKSYAAARERHPDEGPERWRELAERQMEKRERDAMQEWVNAKRDREFLADPARCVPYAQLAGVDYDALLSRLRKLGVMPGTEMRRAA